jgi:transcriptional regulator with XRE-family HTH domain
VEDAAQQRRRAGGAWLRRLREARQLSQRQLAERVGIEYYTFISQIETGRGRIPPERYSDWAEALGADRREFVRAMLYFYEPATFEALFGPEGFDAEAPISSRPESPPSVAVPSDA